MLPFFLLLFEKVHSGDAIFIIISKFFFFKVQFQTKSSLSKTKEILLLQMTFSIEGL